MSLHVSLHFFEGKIPINKAKISQVLLTETPLKQLKIHCDFSEKHSTECPIISKNTITFYSFFWEKTLILLIRMHCNRQAFILLWSCSSVFDPTVSEALNHCWFCSWWIYLRKHLYKNNSTLIAEQYGEKRIIE